MKEVSWIFEENVPVFGNFKKNVVLKCSMKAYADPLHPTIFIDGRGGGADVNSKFAFQTIEQNKCLI